jgi:nucleotide-binding universal stress UspA family protein
MPASGSSRWIVPLASAHAQALVLDDGPDLRVRDRGGRDRDHETGVNGSILVGTDGSSAAGAAVQRAVQLAAAFGCRLLIVSAYAPGPTTAAPPADGSAAESRWAINARDETLELLRVAEQGAREHGIDEVETFARVGDGADAILDIAEEQRCELIVVGHTGLTGATRFLLGSVPSKVSQYAPCSVLIVRTG